MFPTFNIDDLHATGGGLFAKKFGCEPCSAWRCRGMLAKIASKGLCRKNLDHLIVDVHEHSTRSRMSNHSPQPGHFHEVIGDCLGHAIDVDADPAPACGVPVPVMSATGHRTAHASA
jgi:hypothetical protein